MKNKKLTAIVVAAALVANVVLFGLASADDTTSQVQINGAVSPVLTVPASMNFANQSTSASDQVITATATTDSFQIEDLTSDGSTFTVNVSLPQGFSDWSTGQQIVLGATDANVDFDIDSLGTSWQDLSAASCSSTGMVLTENVQIDDLSTYDIVTADSTIRAVDCGLTPDLEITIPGGTQAGTYQNTLTFTLVTA